MATKEKILEIQDQGFCLLKAHFARPVIDASRDGLALFEAGQAGIRYPGCT
jgi:hypothetical protein